jgi:Ankyrin repeats (many copies)
VRHDTCACPVPCILHPAQSETWPCAGWTHATGWMQCSRGPLLAVLHALHPDAGDPVLQTLLAAGADVELTDGKGNTALHYAAGMCIWPRHHIRPNSISGSPCVDSCIQSCSRPYQGDQHSAGSCCK